MRRCGTLGLQAAILATATGQACAQAAWPNVIFTFSAVEASPVPLSPWATAIAAIALLVAAKKVFGRVSGKGAAWLLLIGGLLLAPSPNWVGEARAIGGATTFPLTFPSPMESPRLAWAQNIAVVNGTGQTIRIDNVREPRGIHGINLWPPRATPACTPGLIVLPEAVCYIWIIPATG